MGTRCGTYIYLSIDGPYMHSHTLAHTLAHTHTHREGERW